LPAFAGNVPTQFFPCQRFPAACQPSFFLTNGCRQRVNPIFSLPAFSGKESTEFLLCQRLLTPNQLRFFPRLRFRKPCQHENLSILGNQHGRRRDMEVN